MSSPPPPEPLAPRQFQQLYKKNSRFQRHVVLDRGSWACSRAWRGVQETNETMSTCETCTCIPATDCGKVFSSDLQSDGVIRRAVECFLGSSFAAQTRPPVGRGCVCIEALADVFSMREVCMKKINKIIGRIPSMSYRPSALQSRRRIRLPVNLHVLVGEQSFIQIQNHKRHNSYRHAFRARESEVYGHKCRDRDRNARATCSAISI